MTDLVVLSHLRWTWVWQRPQHLVSRFAGWRANAGARTWFVEEPELVDGATPTLRSERLGDVTRVWLELPARGGMPVPPGFDAPGAEAYLTLLLPFLIADGMNPQPHVLLYTPMALDLADSLEPSRLAYDVMDDLASFRNAPPGLVANQRRALSAADVVFAGGRSLHRGIEPFASQPTHLFPSGVDRAHYAPSTAMRASRDDRAPVAGYVGVIDERLDLDLIEATARALPGWVIRIVGPIAKIDESSLPQAPNIEYPGQASYAELPGVMAGFDVALMPFALNEATRSISPTKTLEYLSAGLPVVSTSVPDVVADYAHIVAIADAPVAFAAAVEGALRARGSAASADVDAVLDRQSWDSIAVRMHELVIGRTLYDAGRSPERAGVA